MRLNKKLDQLQEAAETIKNNYALQNQKYKELEYITSKKFDQLEGQLQVRLKEMDDQIFKQHERDQEKLQDKIKRIDKDTKLLNKIMECSSQLQFMYKCDTKQDLNVVNELGSCISECVMELSKNRHFN